LQVDNNAPLAAAPNQNDVEQGRQDVAAGQATATAAVTLRRACRKAAKPRTVYTPPHMKQQEAEMVKQDWQQYEVLRACRLQHSNTDWYRRAYNPATAQWKS
jgi:hypothetical protein